MDESPPPMYRPSPGSADDCLRQGEVISNLVYAHLSIDSVGGDPEVIPTVHPFAVLMTQDCELAQDFSARKAISGGGELSTDKKAALSNRVIPCLLFCEVATAQELFEKAANSRQKEWDREKIDKNKNERYHFLQKVAPEFDAKQEGIVELGIDFKRYFAVPVDEVYKRIRMGEAARRTILASPYMEHLSSRFAYFLSRVALPLDHLSE